VAVTTEVNYPLGIVADVMDIDESLGDPLLTEQTQDLPIRNQFTDLVEDHFSVVMCPTFVTSIFCVV
jgi:hypothetical protein